jgi:hypothetical protein
MIDPSPHVGSAAPTARSEYSQVEESQAMSFMTTCQNP